MKSTHPKAVKRTLHLLRKGSWTILSCPCVASSSPHLIAITWLLQKHGDGVVWLLLMNQQAYLKLLIQDTGPNTSIKARPLDPRWFPRCLCPVQQQRLYYGSDWSATSPQSFPPQCNKPWPSQIWSESGCLPLKQALHAPSLWYCPVLQQPYVYAYIFVD